jgi:hypothetical protein
MSQSSLNPPSRPTGPVECPGQRFPSDEEQPQPKEREE